MSVELEDPLDRRVALGASGLLREFNEAGVLEAADVHVAARITALAKEYDDAVRLAVALAVRALRGGSVCVDLRAVSGQVGVDGLPWPAFDDWMEAVRDSTLTGTPPVLARGTAGVRRRAGVGGGPAAGGGTLNGPAVPERL